MPIITKTISLALIMSFYSCSTIPEGIEATKPFDIEKYLGKWYEIARFDLRFERNLINTTAEYSLKDDGKIKVVNRGYNTKTNKWESVTGKAKFVDKEDVGMLKVSFFGPFYAGYNVIAIDKDYKYALVSGSSKDYLWILSKKKTIPTTVKDSYLDIAGKLGFDTSKLIWVKQEDKP